MFCGEVAALPMTGCKQKEFWFALHFSRRVEAGFIAGQVSSGGGSLLLREADRKIKLLSRLACYFSDGLSQEPAEHRVAEMAAQRI